MLQINKIKVLNDLVLVEGIKPGKVNGVIRGITIDDKPQEGLVLKVGPGKLLETGNRVPVTVEPGMEVLFNEHTTTKFSIEGKVYYTLREEDIVGFQ